MADDWKTSLIGLGVLFLGAGFLLGRIGLQEFLFAFAALTGSGFMLAKDGQR